MTTKRIVITRADGGVTIRQPLEDMRDGETEAGFLARVIAQHPKPGALEYFIIDASQVPPPDEYRGALTFAGGKFGHDMTKAREVHRERIREARQPLLEAADVAFMRNLETGGDNKPIADEKQRLRDATKDPRIDAAKTVAELKAVWPL